MSVAATTGVELEVEGRRFAVSNLEKPLWSQAAFTKGQMIEYYARVAPVLLPHLARRPVTLRRFPDGVEGVNWYQLQWPRGSPDWLASTPLAGRSSERWDVCLVEDLPSLLWAANLAAVELHPLLARAEKPEEPTVVVFDLDPGPGAEVVDCCAVAFELRELLAGDGLAAFAKTTGSLGLHVYVPLNAPHTYAGTKQFARAVATRLAEERPERVTATTAKRARAGKVLIDWMQNDRMRSTVAPYSLRAAPWPTASTPVTWEEVERAAASRAPELVTFEARHVLDRIEGLGDLFGPVLELEQRLPA